jgi:hypothetical protein
MRAIGESACKKYHRGEGLAPTEAIAARYYDWRAGYADGKKDYHISECPLYPRQPYQTSLKSIISAGKCQFDGHLEISVDSGSCPGLVCG